MAKMSQPQKVPMCSVKIPFAVCRKKYAFKRKTGNILGNAEFNLTHKIFIQ